MHEIDDRTLELIINGNAPVIVRLSEDTLGYRGVRTAAQWRGRGEIKIDNAMKYGAIDYIVNGKSYSIRPPSDNAPFKYSDTTDDVLFVATEKEGLILVECQHRYKSNKMQMPMRLFDRMMEAYKKHKHLKHDIKKQ